MRPEQVCQEIERPIWKNTALERTAINAGESRQYPRAFSIARSIQNAEARSQALILVAESQCRHSPPEEATKTYAEVAEAVARVDQDGLRGVLTGYLVDSLISTGRFEDARACLVLYPTASERFVAMGAIAESEARRGSAERARAVDRQRCAGGLPSGALPPCHDRGTCQDRQLAAEPLLGPGCSADGADRTDAPMPCHRSEPGTPRRNADSATREKRFVPLFGRADTRVERVDVGGKHEEPASQVAHPLRVARTARKTPQGLLASAQALAMVSMASMHLGFSKSPGTPSTWLRSDGPMNSRSTSGIAAISAALASAPAVSIWMPTKVEALAAAMYSASGVRPNRPSRLPPLSPRSPRGQNFAQRTACSASLAERTMLIITPPAPASRGRMTEA